MPAGGVKRKSGPSQVRDNNKKRKQNPATAGKANPFEFRKSKEKAVVLGKNTSVTKKSTGNARAHAFEVRKNALLQELEQQEKNNTFIDKREKKEESLKGLTSHDIIKLKFNKLLGKAPKERGVVKKKNIYNLADNEEVAYTGSSLGLRSTPLDEPDDLNEEGEEGEGEGEGETQDDKGKKKTNRERYAEIIAKSKYHKYMRQKEKEEREVATEELDDALKELQEELYAAKRTKSDADDVKDKKDPDDDYMQLLRTFQMEGRAPASDRSRTTEEIMREENEKLLKLEEDRLKRMLGELQGEGTSRLVSGDDLTDDFGPVYAEEGDDDEDDDEEVDDDELLADLLDADKKARAARRFGGEDEEDEDEGEDEIELDSDEEESDEDEVEEGEREGEEGKQKEAIPFKIEVPEDYKAFVVLLEGRTVKERATIVDRIMVGNHYTLNRAQNVPKMRVFFRILWQRFIDVSKFKSAIKGNSSAAEFSELNHIAKYLWDLAQQFPEITYNLAKDSIEKLYTKFTEQINNTEKALTMQIVVFMQLVGNILINKTDFQNVVVTPAVAFMGHAICLSPVLKVSHLSRVLFLSSLLYNWVSETHRFVTEPLTLLGALLERYAEPGSKAKRYYTCPSLLPLDAKNFQLKQNKLTPSPLDLSSISFADETIATEQQKLDILNFTLLLTSKYFELYTDGKTQYSLQDCTPQLFSPIKAALEKLQEKQLNKSISEAVDTLLANMQKKIEEAESTRKPLILHDSGPNLIDSLTPNYNPEYNGKKPKMSELPERVVKHKMRQRVRKEQKLAAKSIEKDTAFIQMERMKKLRQEDEAAKKHTTKVLSFLQSQAHEKNLDKIRKNPIKFGKKNK